MGCLIAESPELDEFFGALARVERRRLLVALLRDEPVREGSIATDGSGTVVEPHEVDMRHNHLPRLDDLGVVDWDRRDGRVHRGPQFEEIRPFVELLADD